MYLMAYVLKQEVLARGRLLPGVTQGQEANQRQCNVKTKAEIFFLFDLIGQSKQITTWLHK